jgi:hemerythrin superfamily protein
MATKRKQTRGGRTGGTRGRRTAKAAGGRAATRGARSMDALKLLKTDHREVEQLFQQFERARAPKQAELATQICRMLEVHTQIEEEIFYPAAREALKDADLVEEAEVEHQSAKDLIAQIRDGERDEKFAARVKVLGEYVRHHVREEEQQMFKQLNPRRIDLAALGEQLMQRKQALLGSSSGGDDAMDEGSATSSRGRGNGARATREEASLGASPGTRD